MKIKNTTFILLIIIAFVFLSEPVFAEKSQRLGELNQQKLFYKRQAMQQLLANSYEKYPNIPNGMLESLAFTATRWQHRVPLQKQAENGMPQTFGLFGLYHTNQSGFKDLVSKISTFNNLMVEQFLASESIYIDSTAKYIAFNLEKLNADNSIESTAPLLRIMSGINGYNQITEFAIDSYVYDVLNAQNKGFKLKGIYSEPNAVDFDQVFSNEQLKRLGSPVIKLNKKHDKIRSENHLFSKADDDVDYPGALWVPAANFSSRAGTEVTHIVIHTMQGTYAGSIAYFQDPATQASAHYMIRSSDGQITQMVKEFDKAWHVRNSNPYSIGLEHEGYVDNRDWYTEEMLTESAKLSIAICEVYSIDCSMAYDGESHDDVVTLSEDFTVKGHQHYPDQSHTDPGINWDWPYYYGLVTGEVSPNRFPQSSFTVTCAELVCDLDGSSSNDIDGSIQNYNWNFGDGTVAQGQILSHTYSTAGNFTLALTVTDDSGATNVSTNDVTVAKAVEPPAPVTSGGGAIYFCFLLLGVNVIVRRVT